MVPVKQTREAASPYINQQGVSVSFPEKSNPLSRAILACLRDTYTLKLRDPPKPQLRAITWHFRPFLPFAFLPLPSLFNMSDSTLLS